MHPAAFLALFSMVLLLVAALRLEMNFRRTGKEDRKPESGTAGPGRRLPPPELRAAPAGGYWQAPVSPMALRKG